MLLSFDRGLEEYTWFYILHRVLGLSWLFHLSTSEMKNAL